MSPVTTTPAQLPNSNQYGYQASKRIFRQTLAARLTRFSSFFPFTQSDTTRNPTRKWTYRALGKTTEMMCLPDRTILKGISELETGAARISRPGKNPKLWYFPGPVFFEPMTGRNRKQLV
jgi:hypothetical protein